MPALAELQRLVRNAVVASELDAVLPLLSTSGHAASRLSIHRRQYHASLIETLRTRFPATCWLIGDGAVLDAAAEYVKAQPPRLPCVAEFGEDFPAFLAGRVSRERLPWLQAFCELEWQLARVSVAVDAPSLGRDRLADRGPAALMASRIRLQPGLAYLTAAWPVDALIQVYLSDVEPALFQMEPARVHVEVRGARGDVRMSRLGVGEWEFRRSLEAGHIIEDAASSAIDRDAAFDPGRALIVLCDAGLVTGVEYASEGDD